MPPVKPGWFTTHSNDALVPLPDKAIWAATNKNLYQGRLDVRSLRAITGTIESELAVFTEDLFAKEWIESILRHNAIENFDRIEVHALSGDGTAVKLHKNHNADPAVKVPSICFIDGDSKQEESEDLMIYRLPGECPESYICNKVNDKIDEFMAELAISLHLAYEKQERVKEVIGSILTTNYDPHLLFSQIGKKIAFVSETIVRNAFLSIWNKSYSSESGEIYRTISSHLT